MRNEARMVLSRGRLMSFLHCQRQFELRYVNRLAWPYPPRTAEASPARVQAQQEGDLFHQLAAHRFLGFPEPSPEQLLDRPGRIQVWWSELVNHGPTIRPSEVAKVEYTLQVPIGEQALLGRFDLLLVGPDSVRIVDWKTGFIPADDEMRRDWQTRLYFGLVYAGRAALGRPDLQPEQIEMMYWYAERPHRPIQFRYSAAWHTESWGEIIDHVQTISESVDRTDIWPLTPDWSRCERCEFIKVCGREGDPLNGATDPDLVRDELNPEESAAELEGDLT